MYSRRQRALVQLVVDAARDGRLCYHSGEFWVIVKKGSNDLVLQVNFNTATMSYLNASEAFYVLRANPPHKDAVLARQLDEQLVNGRAASGHRTFL